MKRAFLIVVLSSLLIFPTLLWALGEEHFGNAPLSEANYTDWPGVMPIVNDLNRIYHRWVNGNEHCFCRGKTGALNDALRHFAEMPMEAREVIFRPGPGIVHSFNKQVTMPYDWNLHVIGGVAKFVLSKDKDGLIWSKHPTMTVYVGVGGNIELDKVTVPKGIRIIELSDLRERYLKGLENPDKTVRGWGLGELASLDPFHRGNAERVARSLEDPDSWVRLNAVGAIAEFGKTAEFALPALRKCEADPDEQVRKSAPEAIQKIESAQQDAARAKEHQGLLEKIHEFRVRVDKQRNG